MDEWPGERMNGPIKDATVRNAASKPQDPQRPHPYEFVCKTWTSQPEWFNANPLQKCTGLNPKGSKGGLIPLTDGRGSRQRASTRANDRKAGKWQICEALPQIVHREFLKSSTNANAM